MSQPQDGTERRGRLRRVLIWVGLTCPVTLVMSVEAILYGTLYVAGRCGPRGHRIGNGCLVAAGGAR